jgi:Fe-S-cluster containining protein
VPAFAAPSADLAAAVADLYVRLDVALAPAAASCEACGRCCRFEPGGIVLFASALEVAYLVSVDWPPASRVPAGGPSDAAWRCPYQRGDSCGTRAGRTLGCRTHFCREPGGSHAAALHDSLLADLRRIASAADYPWWYGPARLCLAAWQGRGAECGMPNAE